MFSLNSVGKGTKKHRVQYLSHTDTVCFSEDIIQIAMLLFYSNTHHHHYLAQDLQSAGLSTSNFKFSIHRNTSNSLHSSSSLHFVPFTYDWGNKTTNKTQSSWVARACLTYDLSMKFFQKRRYFWSKPVICEIPWNFKNLENTEAWRL